MSDQIKGLPFLTCKVGVVLADLGSGRFRVATNNVASTAISVCNFPLIVGVTVFILSSPNGDYIVGNYANNIDLSKYLEYFPIKEWTNSLGVESSVMFETELGDATFRCNEFVIKYLIPYRPTNVVTDGHGTVSTQNGLIAPFTYEISKDTDVHGRLHFVLDDRWSYDGSHIRSDMTNSVIEAVPFSPSNGANGYATKVIITFTDGIPDGTTVKLLGKQGGLTL